MSQLQKRIPRKISAPMLVVRTEANKEIELRERAALMAFKFKVAKESHFDDLRYMMNLLLIAGQTDASRKYAMEYAQSTIKPVLISIHQRQARTGKLGATDDEIAILAKMIDFNLQFWLRQTTQLFKYCCIELDTFNEELKKAH